MLNRNAIVRYGAKRRGSVKFTHPKSDFTTEAIGEIPLVPRLNRIELLDKLKNRFPEHDRLIKKLIANVLSLENNGENEKFLFQSLSMAEKRIFTIITGIIPLFRAKRGVILSTDGSELELLMQLLGELFPLVHLKLVPPALVKKHWDWIYKGDVAPEVALDEFTDYDILLCDPHDYLLLKSDFKGIMTNVGALSFHNVNPSDWYYCEILALTLKLSAFNRKCRLFYSSTSDLPHIQAISAARRFKTFQLPPFRKDISWYNLVIPTNDYYLYDFYLRNSLQDFHDLDPDLSFDMSSADALIVADERRHVQLARAFYVDERCLFQNLEAISPGERPEEIEAADILLIEDIFLDPLWAAKNLELYLETLLNSLECLKPEGKVVFISPPRAGRTDEMLSGLFPVKINQPQKELIILFLLFHNCLREKELKALCKSIPVNPLFQIRPEEVESNLNAWQGARLVEELHGRYTCTSEDKAAHKPNGHTIVRYKSFLEHKIQLHLDKKCKNKTVPKKKVRELTIKARKLTIAFNFCPYLLNFSEVIQEAYRWRYADESEAEEEESSDEFEVEEEESANYMYSMSNFSRINPKYRKYDPYKDMPEAPAERLAKSKKKTPYYRRKPVGQRYLKHRQYDIEFKARILQKAESLVSETNFPIPWFTLIQGIRLRKDGQIIRLSRSKGYRLVLELIDEKRLKVVELEVEANRKGKPKRRLLRPKYLEEAENQIGFRGRPLKYLAPYALDLTSLKRDRCGECHLFTSTKQCALINNLLKVGKPEEISHLGIRELILHKNVAPHLRIHPHMRACDMFQKKVRDFELRSFPTTTRYVPDRTAGELKEVELLECRIKGCKGVMEYAPDVRTYKCEECHTKYTWYIKLDGQEVINVNVDVHSTKKEVLRKKCGIIEESPLEKKKRSMTKQYRKALRKKPGNLPLQEKNKMADYDPILRENIQRKYGTEPFYKRRMLAILLSCILATLELKTLRKIDDRIINRHVYAQLEQIRRNATASTISQLRTAERVIARQYWLVCKRIFEQIGFPLSDRKLLRYVKEFLEQPFRGSKGYTPANTLINNVHKICYEQLRKLLKKHGFGFECPGFAEHTNPQFGLVLDLSDLLKAAYRFTLIQAIIEGKITENDLYSIFGRHDQEIFLVKRSAFKKLEQLIESTNQKTLYPIIKSTDQFYYEEQPLGKAIDQFIKQLAENLKFKDHLEDSFVYAPDIKDYVYVASILEDYQIPLPISS